MVRLRFASLWKTSLSDQADGVSTKVSATVSVVSPAAVTIFKERTITMQRRGIGCVLLVQWNDNVDAAQLDPLGMIQLLPDRCTLVCTRQVYAEQRQRNTAAFQCWRHS